MLLHYLYISTAPRNEPTSLIRTVDHVPRCPEFMIVCSIRLMPVLHVYSQVTDPEEIKLCLEEANSRLEIGVCVFVPLVCNNNCVVYQ